MNKKVAFILYQYDNFKNDFLYLKEYYNINELIKENKIILKNKRSIYNFIKNEICEGVHLLKDKYIIIKENIKDL